MTDMERYIVSKGERNNIILDVFIRRYLLISCWGCIELATGWWLHCGSERGLVHPTTNMSILVIIEDG